MASGARLRPPQSRGFATFHPQASASKDVTVKVWDLKLMKLIFTFNAGSEVYCLAMANNTVYGGCQDCTIPHLPTSPRISPHLPASPHTSPHLSFQLSLCEQL